MGNCSIEWVAIVDPKTILMPPLYIRLNFIEQFVKSLTLQIFVEFFPKLSERKIKAGIFVVPEIQKIVDYDILPQLLSNEEKEAWYIFNAVVHGFLGNHTAEKYDQLITDMTTNFSIVRCRLSLKIHKLHSHLDKFKNSVGVYSKEHEERLHQDIMKFERRFQASTLKDGAYI